MNLERDSIREFLEKRHKELVEEEYLPRIKKDREEVIKDSKIGKPKSKKIFWVILLLVLFSGLAYFSKEVYERWREADINKNENILESVAELTDIPKDEIPTIVTVTNSESLKGQVFFKDAKIGDKILVFKISKKAILYRPTTNKVISIAPLNSVSN